ncbi:putative uncharacterized protein DDB_G0277255 [Episyrphus balteatus]|uniref:putative uncharacterized protein DDB_G0277255 n=1 Tax=Episyrphus balteatus TaxID=286459 RepID=UPI002484FDB6|nr:putative uncharacterized protein DDB_G0277255 [Episyrphus balteatus]
MTDCSSSIQGSMCSTTASDVISSSTRSAIVSNPRIRVIRLVRPNSRRILVTPDNNVTFGFAIRGGKEFGTGFFVSRVEKSSEADIKGLRVGDQIIRVNGYHVDDAVHKEFTQFVSSQDRLTLKVRGVAMLPMKDNQCDPLSWHIVPRSALSSLNPLMDDYSVGQKDARIILKVAPRTKLGLGICKGPEWKPGIFVQFTKDYSVARDAGLRPGDQILSVNSIDFSDVLFSEAVAVMKSSSTLEMVVRSGAGLDLFPGESSGYNSSASSVTGDQSPCWADQSAKRLSSVREEPLSSSSSAAAKSHLWHDRRKNPPLTSALQSSSASSSCSSATIKDESNKTIIQLSESGTLINNTMVASNHDSGASTSSSISSSSSLSSSASMCDDSNLKLNFIMPPDQANPHHHRTPQLIPPPPPPTPGSGGGDTQQLQHANGKIADICFVSRQSETKTVIVEVHRSATDKNNAKGRAPSPPKPPPPLLSSSSSLLEHQVNCVSASKNNSTNNNNKSHNRTPSIASSSMSIPGSISGTSLCSAISEELKKRRERTSKDTNHSEDNGDLMQQRQPPRRIGNPNCADDERRHSALMDEFKRAHKRMFRNGFIETDRTERQVELRKTAMMQDEVDHRSSNCNVSKTEYNNLISSSMQNDTNGYYPTPPPPPQFANKSENYTQHRSPPNSPAPDYSQSPVHTLTRNSKVPFRNGTLTRSDRNNEVARANGDHAELESIDSYQMRNPSSTIPRPPSLYFAPQNSGPPTMKKNKRPVSVTIGEYSSVPVNRKEPSKLEFIAKSPENGHHEEPMAADLLRSELEQTLSRSNLKKRNEERIYNNYNNNNINNNNNNNEVDQKLEEATSELQNIILRQRSPNGSAYGKSVFQKTQSSNIEKLTQMLQNRQSTMFEGANGGGGTLPNPARVTISVPNNNNHAELRKTESNPSHELVMMTTSTTTSSSTPMANGNGILKNGSAYSRNSYSSSEKSISFGN